MLEKQLPYKYKVYQALKKEILCGNYGPGTVLNERRLCEELGISRTPVREALQMLAQDGWLQTETYKGAVVREVDPAYLMDVAKIRSTLEIMSAKEATRHVTREDLDYLRGEHERQAMTIEPFDVDGFMECDRNFHNRIYQMTHNTELIRLLQNYYDIFQFLGSKAAMNSPGRPLDALAEHQAVLDALAERDPQKAEAAMTEHMKNTEANTISHSERQN